MAKIKQAKITLYTVKKYYISTLQNFMFVKVDIFGDLLLTKSRWYDVNGVGWGRVGGWGWGVGFVATPT